MVTDTNVAITTEHIHTRLQSKIVLPSPPSPNLGEGRGRGHELLYLNTTWYHSAKEVLIKRQDTLKKRLGDAQNHHR